MRSAVAILVALVLATCLTASSALAAEGTGQITGKVTNASTEAPIAGIEVCAFPKTGDEAIAGGESGEEGSEEELLKCPTTGADGEYAISGLASGEYIVGFGSPFLGELNYVTQFYDGKSSFAEAQPVSVAAASATSGIDAKLQEGGRIAGRVTSSSAGAAIKGAIVCAFGASPESGGCALTNSNGEYAIVGLVGGGYKVGFSAPLYEVQYYNGKSTLAEASVVAVLTAGTVSGIDAVLAPKPPASPVGPTSPMAPEGATGSPTKSTGPQARIKLTSVGVIKPRHSSLVHVRLKCSGAPCRGLVELTAQVLGRRREGARVVLGPETLILAKGSFSLAVGRSASIVLRLTPAGRKRLAHVERHPLAAECLLSLTSGKASAEPVRVS
jgi:hypothetical protein